MKQKIHSTTLSTGLAMFSMFFGAGNVVFPLGIGQYAQDLNAIAILGFILTAVGIPFFGLITITLYNGDYMEFFSRMGKIPGMITTLMIMALIGPFGGLPRTITVAYSTSKQMFPDLQISLFSLVACIGIYLLTYKRGRILEILGYLLTPALLISLGLIILFSFLHPGSTIPAEDGALSIFSHSLLEGYKTMDLLAAFFFSGMVILCLREEEGEGNDSLIPMTLKASCIGAGLLAIVYCGFSFVSAKHSHLLESVPKQEMIGYLAHTMLGDFGGPIASIAVSLACLTTAMALAVVFADFLHEDLLQKRLGYTPCLIITLLMAFVVSTFRFTGIDAFLAPILFLIYPSLIVLCIMNFLYKVYGIEWVKLPVAATFFVTLLFYIF